MPYDPRTNTLRPAIDENGNGDGAEHPATAETRTYNSRTRGPGGPGDGNDEPKVGRDVPKAE